MSAQLEDDVFDLLFAFHLSGVIAEKMKVLIKQNLEELYDNQSWNDFINDINDSIKSYNDITGESILLGDTTDLFLAVGLLVAKDEKKFDALANAFFEARGIR